MEEQRMMTISKLSKDDPKLFIEGTIYDWIATKKVSCSDIAELINEFYRNASAKEIEKPFDILDGLNGWCIDDEVAICWGINKLYERFKKYDNDASAKLRAIEIAQELLDHFKENGGNEDGNSLSERNA